MSQSYDIWCEGFQTNGDRGGARFVGRAQAETFEAACVLWYSENPSLAGNFDATRLTDWGCRLFPDEASASESFGGPDMNQPAYTCSVCKRGVAVIDEKIIRACLCVGPVHANMSGHATLAAGMALKPAESKK